jgi:hypothetical protein
VIQNAALKSLQDLLGLKQLPADLKIEYLKKAMENLKNGRQVIRSNLLVKSILMRFNEKQATDKKMMSIEKVIETQL